MKIIAIIQARMGSTRLPGKILKEVNGRPLLSYQLERLGLSEYINQIVIATTIKKQDDIIEEFCIDQTIPVYRGSESDVLARYYEAALKFKPEIIVRITSDCPIIDSQVVDRTIQYFIEHDFDYVSNTVERTYPRGMDTEVFSFEALQKAYQESFLNRDREHVTAYFYSNPEKFKIGSVRNETDYSKYRWTVDTVEDFELIRLIIEKLYDENPYFSMNEVINLMEQNPTWYKMNAHIEQKKI